MSGGATPPGRPAADRRNQVTIETTYKSDLRPDMAPFEVSLRDDPRLHVRGRPRERDRRRHHHRGGGAGPARRHARDPRGRGDDRPPPLGRLRRAPGLRLPRAHARLDRPGGLAGRRLQRARAWTTTSRARTAATATRSPRASRPSGRCTRSSSARGSRAATAVTRERAPRGGPGGARLPRDRRAVRQGGGLLPRPRRRHAHRRLLHRPPGRQRHRRRQRADRHGCGDGPPLRAVGPGRVLLRRRRRLRQRRRARVAQLGGPGAVDQPHGGRSSLRPAGHLLHPEQPLRHDPPLRRGGHGRRPPGRSAPPGFADNNDARRDRSTAWTCWPCATRCAAPRSCAAPGRARC